MKKLFLVLLVIMFTFVLTACSGFEERYPVVDAEGNTTFTLSEVEAMIQTALEDYYTATEVDDYLYESQDMMYVMLDYLLWLNDEAVIVDTLYHNDEDLDEQFDELRNVYIDYFIEYYPDYFDETDRVIEQETFYYEYEGWSMTVEYTSYNYVIVIKSVEMCGDICEPFDTFHQTDFVLTVDELENYFTVYLQMIYNANN